MGTARASSEHRSELRIETFVSGTAPLSSAPRRSVRKWDWVLPKIDASSYVRAIFFKSLLGSFGMGGVFLVLRPARCRCLPVGVNSNAEFAQSSNVVPDQTLPLGVL
jgi:hypothetical protein